jgi:hypothetical protein
MFSNAKYSRNTAYRITKHQNNKIYCGEQALILGKGRIAKIHDGNTIISDLQHGYAKSMLTKEHGSRFFQGKLMANESGNRTIIKNIEYYGYTKPVVIKVEDASDFKVGDNLTYYDVKVGDDVCIPLTVINQQTNIAPIKGEN